MGGSDHVPTSYGTFPSHFGPYALLDVIGTGLGTTVFRARATGGDRTEVALKVVRFQPASDLDRARTRLEAEARLGLAIRDPHLVGYLDFGVESAGAYVAMEMVPGCDLAMILDCAHDEVDGLVMTEVAVQVARGLAALHRAELEGQWARAIHRDLKPANVLVSPDGRMRISDYGVARFSADFYATDERPGRRGSLLYMSPEQVREDEELTQATDVFSYGSLMVEVVLGRPAFSAPSFGEIALCVERADVTEILEQVRDIQPQLEPILGQCLVRDPAGRFPDGSALLEALTPMSSTESGRTVVGDLVNHVSTVEITAGLV